MDQLVFIAFVVIVLLAFIHMINRWEKTELKLINSIERSSIRKVLPDNLKQQPPTRRSLTFDELLDSVSDVEWPSEIQDNTRLSFADKRRSEFGSKLTTFSELGDLHTPVELIPSARRPVSRAK